MKLSNYDGDLKVDDYKKKVVMYMYYEIKNYKIGSDINPGMVFFSDTVMQYAEEHRKFSLAKKRCARIHAVMAGLVYYLGILPFVDDYLRRGNTLFLLTVFVLAPMAIMAIAKVATIIPMNRRFQKWVDDSYDVYVNPVVNGVNMLLFRQDLGRGRICLKAITEKGVSYDVELDGKKYERKIEFKTSVTWGCEDTVISFDNDSVRFELTGSSES